MSVLELNGRIFDASTTGTLTLTSESGAATTDVTQGLNKAWINLNGTGTIALRDSLNVSGVTDVSQGKYTVAINNDMADVNYATVVGNGGYNGGQDLRFQTGLLGNDNHDWGNYTAGTFQLQTKNVANDTTMEDGSLICVTVSGSLA